MKCRKLHDVDAATGVKVKSVSDLYSAVDFLHSHTELSHIQSFTKQKGGQRKSSLATLHKVLKIFAGGDVPALLRAFLCGAGKQYLHCLPFELAVSSSSSSDSSSSSVNSSSPRVPPLSNTKRNACQSNKIRSGRVLAEQRVCGAGGVLFGEPDGAGSVLSNSSASHRVSMIQPEDATSPAQNKKSDGSGVASVVSVLGNHPDAYLRTDTASGTLRIADSNAHCTASSNPLQDAGRVPISAGAHHSHNLSTAEHVRSTTGIIYTSRCEFAQHTRNLSSCLCGSDVRPLQSHHPLPAVHELPCSVLAHTLTHTTSSSSADAGSADSLGCSVVGAAAAAVAAAVAAAPDALEAAGAPDAVSGSGGTGGAASLSPAVVAAGAPGAAGGAVAGAGTGVGSVVMHRL